MENKERQILSEIIDLMTSVRSQLELLDAKMAQLQQLVGQGDTDVTPIDLDIDDLLVDPVVEDVPAEDNLQEDIPVEDTSVEEIPVEEVSVEEVQVEAVPEEDSVEMVEETVVVVEEEEQEEKTDDLPEDDLPFDDDLPIFAEPESVPVQTPAPVEMKTKPAVIDSMTDRQAWRTDMPGTQVKDIRSAISLNDRILFINMLFDQDPMAFQEALTKINQMSSIDEVVEYIVSERPEWNLESETVYRFMMAVRRKIR
jgi:hypothetical protein